MLANAPGGFVAVLLVADTQHDFVVVLTGLAIGIVIAFAASGLGMYLAWKRRQR